MDEKIDSYKTTLGKGRYTVNVATTEKSSRICVDLHCIDEDKEHALLTLLSDEARRLAKALIDGADEAEAYNNAH